MRQRMAGARAIFGLSALAWATAVISCSTESVPRHIERVDGTESALDTRAAEPASGYRRALDQHADRTASVNVSALAEGPLRPPGPDVPAPPLSANFDALDDNGQAAPPGTEGAAGPAHLFVTLQSQFRIQTKSGAVVATTTGDIFFGALSQPGGAAGFHVVFDAIGQRWIIAAIANEASATANVLLAVSQTTDPTGTWNLFSVRVDPNGLTFANSPRLGFNKDWIVVSVGVFNNASSAFAGTQTLVFDKAAAYANVGNGKHTTFTTNGNPPNDDFGLSPAIVHDATASSLYVLEDYDGSARNYRLFEIRGAVGAETFTRRADVVPAAVSAWADSTSLTNGGYVPQPGTTELIDSGDSRVHSVVYRNGSLWCSNNVFLPAVNPTHAAVQWMQIDPTTSTVQQVARIEDTMATATTGVHYMYGSLDVNKANDVMLGFSRAGAVSPNYASAGYTMRFSWDPPSTMRDPTIFKAGGAPYNKTRGGPSNRWGDYSKSSVDPSDDLTMWTIQEYATTTANTWGTWWAKLAVDCLGKPNGAACEDTNLCNSGPKTCQAGTCVGGGAVQCTALDLCHIAGTCDPSTGCSNPPKTCAALDQCHVVGTCDVQTGTCSNPNQTNGTTCTPATTNLCFQSYACQSGACTGGTPVTCTPQDQCHGVGTCAPQTGTCSNPALADGTPCANGTCVGGVCTPTADAGSDAGIDAASEAGTDAGVDAAFEAGTDAGVDAATEAGSDAGVDAASEAGTDAGVDAANEAGSDAAIEASTDAAIEAAVDSSAPMDSGADAIAEASSDSSVAPPPDASGDATDTDASASSGPSNDSGCGCRTAAGSGTPLPATWIALGAIALAAVGRRLRRRRV